MMPSSQNPVVLAAGGTGGHVFPAEALAVELMARNHKLALVTDRRGDSFSGTLGALDVHRIRAGGVAGKSPLRLVQSAAALGIGLVQARGILKRLRPKAVIGFGGYASVPTMLAASFGGYHCAVHEQNAVLGRANRLLAGRVQRIATSFDAVRAVPEEARAKVVKTGMPVRSAIAAAREITYPDLGAAGPINILVLGGSQGARILSDVVPAAVAALEEGLRGRLRISQQCRSEDLARVGAVYGRVGVTADLKPFFDDVPVRLGAAHLVISRSGASSVAEITAVGRPSVLVPYPHAVDDHQSANAHAVDAAGAGWLMPDAAFTVESLSQRLSQLFQAPAVLQKAAACARAAGNADAAIRLADMVEGMLETPTTHHGRNTV